MKNLMGVWLILLAFNGSLSQAAIIEDNTKLWRDCKNYSERQCTIKIKVHRNIPNRESFKKQISEYLDLILKYANLKVEFVERGRYNLQIKRTSTLSHADMGRRGRNQLGLTDSYFSTGWAGSYEQRRGTFIHEFLHTLGFTHEHQHYNRTMNWSEENLKHYCGKWDNKVYSEKYCRNNIMDLIFPEDAQYISEYDFASIMHYNFPSHYRNEKDEAIPYDWGPDYYYKDRTTLSLGDKIALATLYPGKVDLSQIEMLHDEDLRQEKERLARAKYFNQCQVVEVKRSTENCFYTIKKNGSIIPEMKRLCYQKFALTSAIKKMKSVNSCQ